MIYIPDSELDRLLMEDIQGGDLTTRITGIGARRGKMRFIHRDGGCVSGLESGSRILARLGLSVQPLTHEGTLVDPGSCILVAWGRAEALHQGWKVVQNLLEWSCGVSDSVYRMVNILRSQQPGGQIACTRKTIPGTRLLVWQALLAGGGIIHRAGTAESVLLFANHRRFLPQSENWPAIVAALRREAPEKAIVVEVNSLSEACAALEGQPDLLQLDKFSIADISLVKTYAARLAPGCRLSLAGGITLATIEQYARTGIPLMVTSAPYHAPPADIAVILEPA